MFVRRKALSNLDFSQFKPTRFEFEKKDGQRRAVSSTRASFGKLSNGQWPHRSNNRMVHMLTFAIE